MSRLLLASVSAAAVFAAGTVVLGAPQGVAPTGHRAAGVGDAVRSPPAALPGGPLRATASGPRSSPQSGGASNVARWRWPLESEAPVLRRFRAPPQPYASGHRGLDLAATNGSRVLAVEAGVVTHRGWVAGRPTVTLRHHDGMESTYEPVAPTVAAGARVTVGQELGTLAPGTGSPAGHCGARACLHLGARRGDGYVDPWPLLMGGRVVLLPLR